MTNDHAARDVALRDHVRKGDRVRSKLIPGWLGTVELTGRGADECYTTAIVKWDHGTTGKAWIGDLEPVPAAAT